MASRTRLNEFLADLAEFLQKHFTIPVDRTRIDDDGPRIAVLLRHTPSDSALEIEASGASATFRCAGAAWTVEAGQGDGGGQDGLRAALLEEALGVFLGRTAVVAVHAGDRLIEAEAVRGEEAGRAAEALRARHPDADRTVLKRWGAGPQAVA